MSSQEADQNIKTTLPDNDDVGTGKNVTQPVVRSKLASLLRFWRSPVFWVLAFALLVRIFWSQYIFPQPQTTPDTPSYLQAPAILQGKIDSFRTPVYPCFIALLRYCFGEARLLEWVVFCQQAISLIALYFFYRATEILLKSKTAVVLTTLALTCLIGVLCWDYYIMTESLAVSGTVFVYYLLVKNIHSPGIFSAVLLSLLIFILIMLRPSFLFLVPLFLLFWGVRFFQARSRFRSNLAGTLSLLLVVALVLGYCQWMKKSHGFFNVSFVPYLNQVHIIIQSGLYKKGANPRINAKIRELLEDDLKNHPNQPPENPIIFRDNMPLATFYRVAWLRLWALGTAPELVDYASRTLAANRREYLVYSLHKFRALDTVTLGSQFPVPDPNRRYHQYKKLIKPFEQLLTFKAVGILLLVDCFFLLIAWVAGKRFPLCWGILWMSLAASIALPVVGAQYDWSRLTCAALPLALAVLAKYVDFAACEIFDKHVLVYVRDRAAREKAAC